MPQGQYSEADIQQAPAPAQHGQYSEADVLPEQSFTAGAKEFGSQMNPVSIAKGIWRGVSHPIDAAKSYLQAKQKMVTDAEESLSKGDWGGFLRHIQTAGMAVPGFDVAVEQASNKWDQGDKAGALGDAAALVAQTAIGEKVPAIARGAVNTGKYLSGAVPAAAPGVLGGMAKAGAGEVLAKVPGMELPARFGLQYPALRQVAKAIEKGHEAGMGAVKGAAPEAAAAAAVRPARASAAPSVAAPAAVPAPEAAPPAAASGKTAADLLNEEMGTKEAAPPVTTKAPGQALAESHGEHWGKLSEDDKLAYAQMEGAQATAEARNAPPPKAFTARPPEHYGLKPTQTPPTNPASNPPAPPTAPEASAAPPAPANVQPIRPEPTATEPPQPKPASGAVKANAQAKADRFVDAIRRFNSDNPQQALSAEELAGAGDEEKGMLAQGLKQGGYLKNTETFPDTSFPYIVSKLKDAEAEASQTIKPPAGFSLGAMKRYPAPEAASPASSAIDSTPAIKQNAEVTPTAQATPTEAPAKPAFQYKGFLGTLGDTERENLLSVMREYGNKAMKYSEQHAQLRPKYGEVAVGGAHMDPLINQYGIEAVSRELGRGATIEDAIAAGKQEAALTAQKFNARVKGEGGYQIHRPEGLANSMLDEYGRRLRAALKQ